jgi:hypothetical protein
VDPQALTEIRRQRNAQRGSTASIADSSAGGESSRSDSGRTRLRPASIVAQTATTPGASLSITTSSLQRRSPISIPVVGRSVSSATARYLRFLEALGYELSAVERRVCGDTPAAPPA